MYNVVYKHCMVVWVASEFVIQILRNIVAIVVKAYVWARLSMTLRIVNRTLEVVIQNIAPLGVARSIKLNVLNQISPQMHIAATKQENAIEIIAPITVTFLVLKC